MLRFIQTQETSVTRYRDSQGVCQKVEELCSTYAESLRSPSDSATNGEQSATPVDILEKIVEVMTDAPQILHVKAKPTT